MGVRDEIFEQPTSLARLTDDGTGAIARIGEALRDRPVDRIVVVARGSSDHAAIYAQYVFGIRHRLVVALAAPSITTLYGVVPRFERALVIGISQSGASPDVRAVVEAARAQRAPTIALTNTLDSPLAAAADHVVDLRAGPERSVAATKTYTASLLAVALLSAALVPDRATRAADLAAIRSLPASVELALRSEEVVERLARASGGLTRAVVLGRGYEYATAREWALKLKELALVFADPYSAADFEHGPLALIEPGVPVLAVVPSGPAARGLVDLLDRLRRDHGADTLVVSDDPGALERAGNAVALPSGIPEWLRPIVAVVPAQLHAYHLSLARGLDPERPRALSKVTRTV